MSCAAPGRWLHVSGPTCQPCFALCQVEIRTLLAGVILRTKENACEHGGQYLAFVKCKINVCYHHRHHYCCDYCKNWEIPNGSKILYIPSPCLHGKLRDQGHVKTQDLRKRSHLESKTLHLGLFQASQWESGLPVYKATKEPG